MQGQRPLRQGLNPISERKVLPQILTVQSWPLGYSEVGFDPCPSEGRVLTIKVLLDAFLYILDWKWTEWREYLYSFLGSVRLFPPSKIGLWPGAQVHSTASGRQVTYSDETNNDDCKAHILMILIYSRVYVCVTLSIFKFKIFGSRPNII